MISKVIALALAGLLGVYIVLLAGVGLEFLGSGEPIGVMLGIAILVFPLLGVWIVARELRFGFLAQKLAQDMDTTRLEVEGPMDVDRARAHIADRDEDWRAWVEVSAAYHAAGDRRQARRAMNHAVALYRHEARR